ncbi:MAG: hypothetical protein Q8K67_12585 [Geothrix sp.]|nr:hypothetical protein [Geothrix sp.]
MGFKRTLGPPALIEGDALTAAMVGIGMNFASPPSPDPNIEDTLLAASVEGLDHEDYRVLSVLVSWLEIHAAWINADRMTTLTSRHSSDRVRAFWSAVGGWLFKDRRFARMARIYTGPRLDLLASGTAFHLRRSGEDPRFAGGPLVVPGKVLRDRKADVLTPAELARKHRAYRRRILLGPSYRADMWAELEADPSIPPADLARRTYGSFATAWHVKHDWQLLAEAQAT